MRVLTTILLILSLATPSLAFDLGNSIPDKTAHPRPFNPGIPDGRDGGETFADAILIPSLPFEDTGNTSDNVDDYDAICPYAGSTAPDVVYLLPQRAEDLWLKVDMCGSGYDTKIYIMDANQEVIACNDDAYYDEPCGPYVSAIEIATLPAGQEYFLVIDGYGDEAGDYTLSIEELPAPVPCHIEVQGVWEGEPPLHDGYVDTWNSGCNDESGVFPFTHLGHDCGSTSERFWGHSGWYDHGTRDTDWYTCIIGVTGMVHWFMDAEEETFGFLLEPQDCDGVSVVQSFTVGPCAPDQMTIQGTPGFLAWIWVGPTSYNPPEGFIGHEYHYNMTFEGILLEPGTTATEAITLDRIKSLYR